jgi:hypothetical protein
VKWKGKIMISHEVVQTVYCIQLSKPEFKKIMLHDTINRDKPLWRMLHKEVGGISDIEYNGHFGPNVWVTIDKEYDDGKTWNQIDEIITKIIS